MKLSRCILSLLLLPGLAFAQSEEISAPPVDEGAAVLPEAVAESDEAGAEISGEMLDGIRAEEAKRNAPPTPTVTPTATSTESGGSSNSGAMIAGIGGVCIAALGALLGGKNQENAQDISGELDRLNDEAGFQPQADFQSSPDYGASIVANYPAGCEQNFIDKNGNLGPWGRTVLSEIRERPNEFVKNEPPDVLVLCKNYKVFDEKKREQFWVWTMSSLAAPESSCNPKAANRNAPNGTAIGLYQLEKPFCDRFGVYGNLYEPHTNIRCAVRGLATELARRDNLMSPTSKANDSRRTYWGPLRNDDHNKARGGDIHGAKKFRALVAKFPGCGR